MAKIIDFITATSIADNDFLAMADASGNTRKVEKSTLAPLVNDLTTGGIDKYLSAEQGKVVKGLIDTNTTDINTLKDEVNKTSLTNIEIGASPITSLTGMLDGFVDTLIFKGKTMYKTSGGTYTDTYASGVTIESTGESEGKMIMTSLKPDNSVGDTLNASVSKPLRSQGLVKDIYNVVNKTITRYIGQMTFKGASTESWVLGTPPLSTNTLQFKIQIADGKVGLSPTDVNLMCDKFVSDTSANNISNDAEGIAFDDNGYVLVRILKSKLATQDVAGFKLWLASVNTTIVYQLLNSVTETVKKVPTLQTFKDGYLQLQNAIIPTVNFNYSVELASVVSEHTRVIDELEDVVVDNVNKIGVLNESVADYDVYASTKDGSFYTVVDYKRLSDSTLYLKSTLSNKDANGYFQTCVLKFYGTDGITVTKTQTWSLTYDSDGLIINKVVS